MRTLKQYQEEINKLKNSPGALANLNVEIAADYAFSSEIYGKLEIMKAKFIVQKKYSEEKPLSDVACNSFWLLEKEGESWRKVRSHMKGLEKIGKAISNLNYVATNESKNNF